MKLLTEFLREKHDQRNPEDIQAKEFDQYIYEFILSVKLKDGKDFEPSTLRGLFLSFNRHLKECKYPVSVIEDVVFDRARKYLEAKNKQLKLKEGKGNRLKVHLTPKYFFAQINPYTCLKRIAPFCPFLTQILTFYRL